MLENVSVNSIKIGDMGGFQNSKLQKYELEYILSHIVRMSQTKGKWITEFTLKEFIKDFNFARGMIFTPEQFSDYFAQLLEEGYLEFNEETQTAKVTKKFEKLCEEYSY